MVEIAGRPDLAPEVQGEASQELRDQFISAARPTDRWVGSRPCRAGGCRTFRWYRDNLPNIEG